MFVASTDSPSLSLASSAPTNQPMLSMLLSSLLLLMVSFYLGHQHPNQWHAFVNSFVAPSTSLMSTVGVFVCVQCNRIVGESSSQVNSIVNDEFVLLSAVNVDQTTIAADWLVNNANASFDKGWYVIIKKILYT